jgi:hypothetical protein
MLYALCPIPNWLSQPSNGSWLPDEGFDRAQRNGVQPDVIERQLAHQERNAVRADWADVVEGWQSSSYAAGVAAAGVGGIALRTIFETEQADA